MLNKVLQQTRSVLLHCQQLRFLRTNRFQHAYGEKPIFRPELLEQEQEQGKLDELQFQRIRFAHLSETSSPLYDASYERFARYVMQHARKDLAYKLTDETLYVIKSIQFKKLKKQQQEASTSEKPVKESAEETEKVETDPLNIMREALKNCEPYVITKPVRRGGATYQVPYPLQKSQSEWFALKWLIQAVRDRPKPRRKHFPEVMAQEILDAYYKRGKVIKKRDDMHRLADSNRAFAHYRWG